MAQSKTTIEQELSQEIEKLERLHSRWIEIDGDKLTGDRILKAINEAKGARGRGDEIEMIVALADLKDYKL